MRLKGSGRLISTIGLVQEHYNPVLLVSTMLVTMFDRRTILSRQVYDEVKSHYPNIVLDTTIPRSVKISEAPSFSRVSLPMTLVAWVLSRMGRPRWKWPDALRSIGDIGSKAR